MLKTSILGLDAQNPKAVTLNLNALNVRVSQEEGPFFLQAKVRTAIPGLILVVLSLVVEPSKITFLIQNTLPKGRI